MFLDDLPPGPVASSIDFSCANSAASTRALATPIKQASIKGALGRARTFVLMTRSLTAATQKRLAGQQEPGVARVTESIF
jgi:hypothetical protein